VDGRAEVVAGARHEGHRAGWGGAGTQTVEGRFREAGGFEEGVSDLRGGGCERRRVLDRERSDLLPYGLLGGQEAAENAVCEGHPT
jgi:hypothetical protein